MKNIKIHFINSFFDFDHFINSFFDFDFEFYSSFNFPLFFIYRVHNYKINHLLISNYLLFQFY